MKTEPIKKHHILLVCCFLVNIVGVAGYVFWANYAAEKEIYTAIDQRLLLAAKGLKYMLAPDFHDRALDEQAIGMQEELRNRRAMTDFGRETGFQWVYTLVEKEGRYYFSAPSVSEEEARERERWYFYPYADVPPGFVAALKENRIVYTTYRDQWGYFRSVALPQVSPGGRRYLACADYEVTYVQGLKRKNYIRSLTTAVYFLLFSVPFLLVFRKIWGMHAKELQRFNTALLEHRTHLEDQVRERTADLENQRTFLRQVIDINPHRIYAKDRAGRFTLVNQAVADAYGRPVENLLGKTEFEVHPVLEEAERFRRDDLEVLETQKEKRIAEEQISDAAGRARWFQTVKRPIRDAAGRITQILGVSGDITELKNNQDERINLEIQLQRSQKLEAIGILAGGVAHDLNNILTGLVSYPELLLLDLPPDSPLRDAILLIQRSGEKAAAVVQDLLTLARGVAIARESIDLNEIVRDFMGSPEYERLLYYHPDIRVETDLEEELSCLAGSPVHISKVLMNLAANATEAMPKGGVLRIGTRNRRLEQTLDGYEKIPAGDYVLLSVEDTGSGISDRDMARIFEPFYTKKVMGRSGSGLGLSVVWGMVKDHKGFMNVQGVPGSGTRMEAYFPVSRTVVLNETADIGLEPYLGRSERVLVVDDVDQQRTIAEAILDKLGYEVLLAAGGDEAVQLLKQEPVDLVLLDMIMEPGPDGLDTFKQIREARPKQKILLVSGFSETDRVKEALRLGAGGYLKKPYSLRKLAEAVRKELDK